VGLQSKTPGLISGKIFRAEGDQNTVLVLEEWESHDAWHDYANKVGEEFQSRAGTEGLDWQDTIWVLSDAPQAP
jgi:heme-degrading monooxygenase HmoA